MRRGVLAQSVQPMALIHEGVGSTAAMFTSSVLPKLVDLMKDARGIGQAKSPTIVGLAPGEVPQS